jgi:hypothetical protein
VLLGPQNCLAAWRRGQIATLTWEDVDRSAGVIVARAQHVKSGRAHKIVLEGELDFAQFAFSGFIEEALARFAFAQFSDLRPGPNHSLTNSELEGLPEQLQFAVDGRRLHFFQSSLDEGVNNLRPKTRD